MAISDSRRLEPLEVSRPLAKALIKLYDYPHPRRPGRTIRGYDRPHAVRTAKMCVTVADRLGHPCDRVRLYHVACLLHDLGRAGLDRQLFGTIWSWAKQRGIPTRPREWRALHPRTTYGRETEAFVSLYREDLVVSGVAMDTWAVEQIEMRLGYARRLARRLRAVKPIRPPGSSGRKRRRFAVVVFKGPKKLQAHAPPKRVRGPEGVCLNVG